MNNLPDHYINLDRLDIIAGCTINPPVNPCDKCKSKECEGKGKCKGFGAYIYGLTI